MKLYIIINNRKWKFLLPYWFVSNSIVAMTAKCFLRKIKIKSSFSKMYFAVHSLKKELKICKGKKIVNIRLKNGTEIYLCA